MSSVPALAAGWALVLLGGMLALPASPSWPALLFGCGLLVAAQILSPDKNDRLIVRAFAGVPLVIALAAAAFWAGVVAQAGILVLILSREDILPTTRMPVLLGTGIGSVLVVGALIGFFDRMLLPFILVCISILAGTGILWVRLYRLKRIYRSPNP